MSAFFYNTRLGHEESPGHTALYGNVWLVEEKDRGKSKDHKGAAVATFWKPFLPLSPGCLHEQESLGKGVVTWRKQSQEPWRRAFGRDRELMQTSVAFSTPEAIFPPTAVGVPP